MEDISRELERELIGSKPTPYKKSRNQRILIMDDFGEVKSGRYLKSLVYIFSFTSLVCLLAACGLYYLFSELNFKNRELKKEKTLLEQKLGELAQEKEVLMARLVISGKESGTEPEPPKPKTENAESEPVALPKEDQTLELNRQGAGSDGFSQPMVTIEKFSVTRKGGKGDLLVKFDIRNISDKPGEISGRIFTILKPENRPEGDWRVVPEAPLKNGIPADFEKGQYFSISHFKPIKFKIDNQTEQNLFKNAVIYVFNETGDLVFESTIDIQS